MAIRIKYLLPLFIFSVLFLSCGIQGLKYEINLINNQNSTIKKISENIFEMIPGASFKVKVDIKEILEDGASVPIGYDEINKYIDKIEVELYKNDGTTFLEYYQGGIEIDKRTLLSGDYKIPENIKGNMTGCLKVYYSSRALNLNISPGVYSKPFTIKFNQEFAETRIHCNKWMAIKKEPIFDDVQFYSVEVIIDEFEGNIENIQSMSLMIKNDDRDVTDFSEYTLEQRYSNQKDIWEITDTNRDRFTQYYRDNFLNTSRVYIYAFLKINYFDEKSKFEGLFFSIPRNVPMKELPEPGPEPEVSITPSSVPLPLQGGRPGDEVFLHDTAIRFEGGLVSENGDFMFLEAEYLKPIGFDYHKLNRITNALRAEIDRFKNQRGRQKEYYLFFQGFADRQAWAHTIDGQGNDLEYLGKHNYFKVGGDGLEYYFLPDIANPTIFYDNQDITNRELPYLRGITILNLFYDHTTNMGINGYGLVHGQVMSEEGARHMTVKAYLVEATPGAITYIERQTNSTFVIPPRR